MRILHVTHQYPPDRRGGVEVYTQALAQQQARQGHAVAVLRGWADRVNEGPLDEQGEKTEDWGLESNASETYSVLSPQSLVRIFATTPRPSRHPLESFVRSFHNPALDRAFETLLSELRPTVVHIQHLKGLSARLPTLARRWGIPVVYTLHDWWTFCGNAQLLRHTGKVCGGPRLWLNCADCAAHHTALGNPPTHQPFQMPNPQTALALAATPAVAALFAYRARLLEASLRAADVVIAPTAYVRERYAQQGLVDARWRVVEHGIDYPDRRQKAEGERQSEERNPHHALRIGYLGGLAWQKGVHVLVEAFNAVPPDAAELIIYGDPGPFPAYVAQLRGLAHHPRIRFAGPYAPEDRWRILAELDLVVVPSVWPEISSLVTQEAFAAGAPVIASRIGALAQRVHDGVNGRLVPPGDVASLAAVLAELTSQPSRMARLAEGVRPPRTLAEHVGNIERIYRELTD